MTILDWFLVFVINGAIIVYGLILSRQTKSSADWFLAGRTLPWWIVGLSLYATAIDSSDLVAGLRGNLLLRDELLCHQLGRCRRRLGGRRPLCRPRPCTARACTRMPSNSRLGSDRWHASSASSCRCSIER